MSGGRHGWWIAAVLAAALPSAALAQDNPLPPLTTASPTPAPLAPESAAPDPNAPQTNAPQGGAPSGNGYQLAVPLPPLQLGGYADLAVGYSTNAQGFGNGGDDTFMRGTLGAFLQYNKPRLTANLSYSLTGVYWSKFHDQNHLTNRLNAGSRLIVVPDMLVLNANAFAAPADLTRLGPRSASGEPISRFNTRDTYGYSVEPEFFLRFKDYLTSTLTASHGAVFFVQPSTAATIPPPPITPAQNAYSTSVMEQLTSGDYFSRLQFSLIGSYGQFSQTTQTERTDEGVVNLAYAVTRWLKVFALGGYSEYKATVPLARNLNGPTGLGGVTLTNGPDLTLTVEAGTQHNLPTYLGSFRWIISPLTQFYATATDTITTPQGDLLSNLAQMSLGGLGNYGGPFGFGNPSINNIDTGLGGFNPFGGGYFGPGGLSLDNSIYRIRSVNGNLTHTDERMTYALGVFANERDQLNLPPGSALPRTSVYGITASVSRQMSERLTATASASYSIGNEFGGHDRIFYADAYATYRLSPIMDIYLTNHYDHRSSTNLVGFSNAPVSEDQIILGIRAHF